MVIDSFFLGFFLGSGRRSAVAALSMQFRRFGVVMNCELTVSVGEVGMVRGLFVLLGLVVFRCLIVMVGCALMMTSSVMVMFPSLRHTVLLRFPASFWDGSNLAEQMLAHPAALWFARRTKDYYFVATPHLSGQN
jgi:hypothetical protein